MTSSLKCQSSLRALETSDISDYCDLPNTTYDWSIMVTGMAVIINYK